MSILNPAKALRSLKKTPLILQSIMQPITQEMAQSLRDGDDGWSILYIMCHLHDYEAIFMERLGLLLDEDNPTFPIVNNDDLIREHDYDNQQVHQALDVYLQKRRDFIQRLENLTDEQWLRRGIHPATGETTVLTLAINTALHDIDHIGQMLQAIG